MSARRRGSPRRPGSENQGSRRSLPERPHAHLRLGPAGWPTLLLAREHERPEAVGVAAVGALGLEGHVARGHHGALDAVELGDELAVAREVDVPRRAEAPENRPKTARAPTA